MESEGPMALRSLVRACRPQNLWTSSLKGNNSWATTLARGLQGASEVPYCEVGFRLSRALFSPSSAALSDPCCPNWFSFQVEVGGSKLTLASHTQEKARAEVHRPPIDVGSDDPLTRLF